MRYKILQPFTVKTSQGITELQAGQIITLQTDKAYKLIDSGKVRPLRAILDEKYKSLMQWLKGYPVTDFEIKETMPEHYQKIQDAITEMDSHYYNENLQGFTEAMDKVKSLYLEAMNKVNQVKLTNQES